MPTRAQIKRKLQALTVSKLRAVQSEAAAECQLLSPQLAELEESAPDSAALEEVRALFDEVCTRAQEADIELERRSRVGRGTPAPKPAAAEPTAPVSVAGSPYWPPPWWAWLGAAGVAGVALVQNRKRFAKQQSWLTAKAKKVTRKIRR